MLMVSELVVVGVLDESLADEVAERVEAVFTVMEDTSTHLQGFHSDGTTAGRLYGHINASGTVSLISAVAAIVMAIAQADLLNAKAVAALEVDVRVHISRASRGRCQICWHEEVGLGVTSQFI
jgi:Holliday junction resolvasome RuvABC endonuclease subunit